MNYSPIKTLIDLDVLRTAPTLDSTQIQSLLGELAIYIKGADWFTIGIMAPSAQIAIYSLRQIETYYGWLETRISSIPNEEGPVFLKANQMTKQANIRIEQGLGIGIILSCQHDIESKDTMTFGPFPLDFFETKC